LNDWPKFFEGSTQACKFRGGGDTRGLWSLIEEELVDFREDNLVRDGVLTEKAEDRGIGGLYAMLAVY
jgi:hypothetical protein